VTATAGQSDERGRLRGIRASARRVVAQVGVLAQLERELARAELERKRDTLAAGGGLAVAAGVFTLYAIGFGLAAVAAALALVVDWWLALLIVFVALLLLVLMLGLVARSLFGSSTPLKPEQAIEEARLTKEALRSTLAG
jgi:Flp pilus assembly protein TadB